MRANTGRLLRYHERRFVAWDGQADRAIAYNPTTGRYDGPTEHLALDGEHKVATADGAIGCRPVFDHYATCWIPRAELEEAARLIWHARPTSYYAWSGHEHHANATETARSIALLYALTGCFDAPGGNVLLPAIPAASITGEDLPAANCAAATALTIV